MLSHDDSIYDKLAVYIVACGNGIDIPNGRYWRQKRPPRPLEWRNNDRGDEGVERKEGLMLAVRWSAKEDYKKNSEDPQAGEQRETPERRVGRLRGAALHVAHKVLPNPTT